MRWLALVVLGACSFSPGTYTVDASGSGTGDDAGSDSQQASLDAGPDAPPSPLRSRAIEIVAAQVTGGPHADFPLLVDIADETWLRSVANGGDVQHDEGNDIYFTLDAAGATPLSFEIERYRPDAGDLVAWVKVPSLTTNTVIYMHYGDPAIVDSRATPPLVWSADYQMVVHLNGTGDATGMNGGLPGVNLGIVAGQIGLARSFDGSLSYSNAGSLASVDDAFSGGGTIEGWFNPSGYGGNGFGRLFDKNAWGLFVDNVNTTRSLSFFYNCTGGNNIAQWHFGTSTFTLNAWNHIALVFDSSAGGTAPTAYINGTAVATTVDDPPTGSYVSDASSNLYLGNVADGTRAFSGALDELRLSSVARSPGWLATQFRNQSSPGAFYSISAPLSP